MKRAFAFIVCFLTILTLFGPFETASGASFGTLQTFTITEQFGVTHPDQIVTFDYAGASGLDLGNTYMTGPSGSEVPFQVLSGGKIAVRTDLPANASYTWQLKTGQAPSATASNSVSMTSTAGYYELTNGITGVRVTRSSDPTLAPIQGVLLQNGVWTDTGPNRIYQQGPGSTQVLSGLNVAATVVESGPLETVIKVAYNYDRPAYCYDVCSIPAGPGHYTSIITLEAGQPSILLDEDTDMDLQYNVNIYSGVKPDQGRWRGHDAQSAEFGYEPGNPSMALRPDDQRTPMDAFRDFDYSSPIYAYYQTYDDVGVKYIGIMSAWDPWASGTGHYWMLYNKSAGTAAPVVGAFMGKASLAVGASDSGPGPYLLPDDGAGSRAAGFNFQTNRRDPSGKIYGSIHINWGIYVGTKGDAGFNNAFGIQPIAVQQNIHGGINLDKISRYATSDFPDNPGGYGGMYMDPGVLQGIISRLRAEVPRCSETPGMYYAYLYNTEPTARNLLDMWANCNGVTANTSATDAASLAQNILNSYVNGDGIYDFNFEYWKGGLAMGNEATFMDSILADPLASAASKVKMKSIAALFGYVLYDDDFVPLDNFDTNKLNAGTANMPLQQEGYRYQFAMFLSQHPYFSQFIASMPQNILTTERSAINDQGANISSPHYSGASFEPTLNGLLQLKRVGQDLFANEPRLSNAGEFFMQLLTPPEVRFGTDRKYIAAGDGATEGTEMTGLLATGFQSADPGLAARLMGAWTAGGKVHSGFFGTTLVKINENAPQANPALKDANFGGYMSVLRNGWNTDNETDGWLFNGDWYSDHRHDDRGSLVLYALKAPLSVNWGGVYTPQTPGPQMKNMVVPDSNFPAPGWSGSGTPLTGDSGWTSSASDSFASFSNSGFANAKMVNSSGLTWTRRLYSIHPNDNLPIIMIKDDFGGVGSAQNKDFTVNLMAQGPVQTPDGSVTPAASLNTATDGSVNALPSASRVITLGAGVNKFSFTGQTWNQHPTKGIDWDLYEVAPQAEQAVIGNWGQVSAPNAETNEYQAANGTPFKETQDILRIHGAGSFQTIILPWNKGQKPSNLALTQQGGDIVISRAGETIKIGSSGDYYTSTDGNKTVLAAFGSGAVSGNGMTLSGGPGEVSMTASQAALSFSGPGGVRTFTIPGDWTVDAGVSKNGSIYTYNYQGTVATIITLTKGAATSIPIIPIVTAPPVLITSGQLATPPTPSTPPAPTAPVTPTIAATPTAVPTTSTTPAHGFSPLPSLLTSNLLPGSTNAQQVTILQTFLKENSYLPSSFFISGIFDSLTTAALKKYQCDQDIVCTGSAVSTGWGSAGPKTRMRINQEITRTISPSSLLTDAEASAILNQPFSTLPVEQLKSLVIYLTAKVQELVAKVAAQRTQSFHGGGS